MTSPAVALGKLLETERDLLLNGQLERVDGISERKEDLLPKLGNLDPNTRQTLKLQAAQNQALLGAALRGLRGAIRRINAIGDTATPIQTYGADGERTKIGQPHMRALEKRA